MSDTLNLQRSAPVVPVGLSISIPVGEACYGRLMNVLGEPIDGQGPIAADETRPIRQMIQRKRLVQQDGGTRQVEVLETGIKIIDLMFPMVKGSKTGILGGAWMLEHFEPFAAIPSSVKLTTFQSETLNIIEGGKALQAYVDGVAAGRHHVRIERVFRFDEIVEAHRYMETNRATGKLVVVVDGA